MFAHLYRSLSQWVGTAGCQALFTRAIMLSAQQHPVLRGVRYQPSAEPHFDRFADNGGVHGGDAIAEAVTSVLASIITMLNGLIGEDIATNLLEEALPSEPAGATPSESAIEQDPHTVPRRGRPTETQSDD